MIKCFTARRRATASPSYAEGHGRRKCLLRLNLCAATNIAVNIDKSRRK